MEAIVHLEVYQDFTPEKNDRIYSERENSAFTKDLLDINQKETLAQILTDKRYTRKDNEFFRESFWNLLRGSGLVSAIHDRW